MILRLRKFIARQWRRLFPPNYASLMWDDVKDFPAEEKDIWYLKRFSRPGLFVKNEQNKLKRSAK